MDYETPNAVIVWFPNFSGGKFIINCLALSKGVVPPSRAGIAHILANRDDYAFRENLVHSTLPASKEEMRDWLHRYELRFVDAYGAKRTLLWNEGVRTYDDDQLLSALMVSGLRFFVGTHEDIRNFRKVWPNATVLRVTNAEKFRELAYKLKHPCHTKEKYEVYAGEDWPSWEEVSAVGFDTLKIAGCKAEIASELSDLFAGKVGLCADSSAAEVVPGAIEFSVDDCIFDKDKFLCAMAKLYEDLGLDDFNPKLVGDFWQSYINLHM